MITSFTPSDLLLLMQTQGKGASLWPAEELTRPRLPVWSALTSLISLDQPRSLTLVLNEPRRNGARLQGFLQAEQPPMWPEMYLRYISPSVDENLEVWETARTVWTRLLTHAVSAAGERGLQRVFASVPDQSEALHVMVGSGFSVYTREEIYRLIPDAHPQAAAGEGIRPERSVDAWYVNQLFGEVVPHLVQQAEALTASKGVEAANGLLTGERGEGFVLADRTGVVGYGHLLPGRVGHWLTLIVHPRAYDQAEALLDYGLALLNYYPAHPVYCAVREYQGGIRAPLEARGFGWVSRQCRMVKHTTVRVAEPARSLVHALEKRAEASTPTASRTEGR
jgi:hypothetical protein